jgi:hypothetical protein
MDAAHRGRWGMDCGGLKDWSGEETRAGGPHPDADDSAKLGRVA